MNTNEKFVVYVMISSLLKDVHELDLFHRFIGRNSLNQFSLKQTVFSYVRRRSLSPVRSLTPIARPLISSISSDDSIQKIRESTLIQRFNDLYARERLDAMDTLRTVSDDYEMNQRICFNIIQV